MFFQSEGGQGQLIIGENRRNLEILFLQKVKLRNICLRLWVNPPKISYIYAIFKVSTVLFFTKAASLLIIFRNRKRWNRRIMNGL